MMARGELEKLQASGVENFHATGRDYLPNCCLLAEISVINRQLVLKSIKDKSLFVSNTNISNVIELAEAAYMMNNLIIENMTVVKEV